MDDLDCAWFSRSTAANSFSQGHSAGLEIQPLTAPALSPRVTADEPLQGRRKSIDVGEGRPDKCLAHGCKTKRPGALPAFFIFACFWRSTAPCKLRGLGLKYPCDAAVSLCCACPAATKCRPPYPDSARSRRCPDPSAIRRDPGDRTGPGRRYRRTCRPCWRRKSPWPATA